MRTHHLKSPSGVVQRRIRGIRGQQRAVAHLRDIRTDIHDLVESRWPRPWLGMVAVPLEATACILVGYYNHVLIWTFIPLAVAAWWWCPRESRWIWLLALQGGCVGAEWAFVGAAALAVFPNHLLLVGVIWGGFAAALAGTCAFVRWRENRSGY